MEEKKEFKVEEVHKLMNFLLIGTVKDMRRDCKSRIDILQTLKAHIPVQLSRSWGKFYKLSVSNLSELFDELKDCPPSHFVSSKLTEKETAMSKLEECALSPIISQPYSQRIFF